jgi:hypothetical protein
MSDSKTHRDAIKALQGAERRYYLRNGLIIFALTVIAPLLYFMIYVFLPLHEKRDTLGEPLHEGKGKVTGIYRSVVTRGNTNPSDTLLIRLGSQTVFCASRSAIREGDEVDVTYIIGRSGTIYVEQIEPLK